LQAKRENHKIYYLLILCQEFCLFPFDSVYFKPAIDLNKPLSKISFESCIIYELKPLARTFEEINGKQEWTGNGIELNPPDKNTKSPTQMSEEWDDDVIR
jgi:hypothetical protein